MSTSPSVLLDCDAACWWSFYDAKHRFTTVPRKTVPEDFEFAIPPKSGSSVAPSTVTVKFLTNDANT